MNDGCHDGWLKFQRSWLYDENIWLTGVFSREKAWIDLVARAEFRQTEVKVRGIRVLVGRGQLAASERSNRIRWRWSKNKILRYLRELESEQQIIIHRSNVINIISIVDYDEIMGKSTPKGTPNGATGGATEPEKRSNTIYNKEEEYKNFKEGEEYTPLPPKIKIFSFDKFFNIYGKNVNYEKCRYLWSKLNAEDHEKIFEHAPNYVSATPDKRFRKDPDKYIEEKIWKNEIIDYGKRPKQQSTEKNRELLEKIARETGRYPGQFTDE